MADQVLDIIIKTLVAGIAGGTLTIITLAIKWLVKWFRAITKAVKALNHDSLFRQCRYLQNNDSITEAELENANYLYDAYRGLGLNGTGEEMYKRCVSLPLKKKNM